MNTKVAALAALLCMSAASSPAQAATAPTKAFNACVKAFVTTYLPGRAVRTAESIDSSRLNTLALTQRRFTIAFSARGAESGAVLAEARCVADGKGIVLVLDKPATLDYLASADIRAEVR